LDASVEHILLELGVHAKAGLREIEQELEQLTLVDDSSVLVNEESKRIRADRWKLASIEHQVSRFKLDRDRETIAKAARLAQTPEELANNATSDEALSTAGSPEKKNDVPAVTISFRQPSDSGLADVTNANVDEAAWSLQDKQTWNALLASKAACIKSIEAAEQKMHMARMQAAGTIAITGAPRYGVVSGYASLSHIISILALSTSGAIGLGFLLRSPSGRNTSTTSRKSVPKISTSPIRSSDISDLMAEHQIKCFGTIEVRHDATSDATSYATSDAKPATIPVENLPHEAVDTGPTSAVGSREAMRMVRIAKRVEQLNNWALWTWVGLFLVRFFSDANWRELLFNAPLAAFSSIVLGVY
jgi:hypothetical protein